MYAIQKQRPCSIPLLKKDGSKLPVESKIWYGTWNNQNCFYIISKDLSIQASALDKFYKIFSCSPALTAINTIGNNNNFVDINNSFIENLGYSRKEIIGKNVIELNLFPEIDKFSEVAKLLSTKNY